MASILALYRRVGPFTEGGGEGRMGCVFELGGWKPEVPLQGQGVWCGTGCPTPCLRWCWP